MGSYGDRRGGIGRVWGTNAIFQRTGKREKKEYIGKRLEGSGVIPLTVRCNRAYDKRGKMIGGIGEKSFDEM